MLRKILVALSALIVGTPAFAAADVGLFPNRSTDSITSPVANKTYTLKDGVLWMYNGTTWQSLAQPKPNLSASTAPGAGDDSDDGYAIGSLWCDTVAKKVYVCVDATVGAAVWKTNSDTLIASDVLTKLNTADAFSDWLISGLLGSVPVSSLTMSTPSGLAYAQGKRVVSSGYGYTYTASRDTYDYLQGDGTVNHIAVTNGASAPTGQPGLLLQKVVTNGSAITSVTQLAPKAPVFVASTSLQSAPVLLASSNAQFPNGVTLANGTGISLSLAGSVLTIAASGGTAQTGSSNTFGLQQIFTVAPKFVSNSIETAAGGTNSIPEGTDTFAMLGATQTFSNKTHVNPTISGAMGGNFTVSGTATFTNAPKLNANAITTSSSNTVAIPDAADTLVNLAGTQTLSNKTLTSPTINTPTFGAPLPQASIGNGAKRQVLLWPISSLPLADNTPYYTYLPVMRACTIKKIVCSMGAAPSGTLTIAKGSGGPTLLSTATLDCSTLTPDAANTLTLTSTSGNLSFAATDNIYLELDTLNPQPSPVDAATIAVEIEPSDF